MYNKSFPVCFSMLFINITFIIFYFRLRLFGDVTDSPETTKAEIESILTPETKGNNSVFENDTPSCVSSQTIFLQSEFILKFKRSKISLFELIIFMLFKYSKI